MYEAHRHVKRGNLCSGCSVKLIAPVYFAPLAGSKLLDQHLAPRLLAAVRDLVTYHSNVVQRLVGSLQVGAGDGRRNFIEQLCLSTTVQQISMVQ